MTRTVAFAALALLTACSVSRPGPAGARASVVPRVDHHQHVLGPTALPARETLLPFVDAPAELERLLQARARLYANAKTAADLADVFTPDATVLTWQRPSKWIRGETELMGVMNRVVAQSYRFRLHTFHLGASHGSAGGIVDVADQYALDFLLGLRKGDDGLWRIASESTTIRYAPPWYRAPITAQKVIADLDAAGIDRAMVLSVAFWLGTRFPDAEEMTAEHDAVRAENDWVAAQIAPYAARLVAACSANPLRGYAIRELERCKSIAGMRAFKLHFADSGVDLGNADHLDKLARFFAAANRLRTPLIIHLKPRVEYGPREVETILSRLVAAAPDIPIQIAHLGGDGPGIDAPDALAAFAEARAARDPRTRRLYFDIAGLVTKDMDAAQAELMVRRMRQIGLEHVLYASDGQPPNASTAEHWMQTRLKLPLTNRELRTLANNVAPYMR